MKIIKKLKSLIKKTIGFTVYNKNPKSVQIGINTIIENSSLSKNVKIGRDCYIFNSKIGEFTYSSRNVSIMVSTIGKFCSIGKNVSIGIGDHPTNFISTSPLFYSPNNPFGIRLVNKSYFDDLKPVNIGNDVWIGANAIIKNGLKIGDGAIIGANSVVTKDVPSYTIVAGNPARILRKRFSDDKIRKIESLKWWDWDINKIKNNLHDFQKPIL